MYYLTEANMESNRRVAQDWAKIRDQALTPPYLRQKADRASQLPEQPAQPTPQSLALVDLKLRA